MLAIPGLGPLLAAGPLVATLAGIGAGGTVGGFTGALIGLGLPEYEAKRYEGRIRRGGILLSVHCDDSEWKRKAKAILKHAGAEHIASTSEATGDFANSDRPLPATLAATELGAKRDDLSRGLRLVLQEQEVILRSALAARSTPRRWP